MRVCAKCHTEDRPEVGAPADCDCGAFDRGSEDHKAVCGRFRHSVAQYPIRMQRSELTMDKQLTPHYKLQGWALLRDGERFYRVMLLCRNCIRAQEEALSVRKDYLKACRAAKGVEDRTYSQMLAQQGS